MVVEQILEPIAGDEVCGPNLEYDPDFTELERLAAGRPAQQMGDAVVEAEEPNWSDVKRRALDLLGRSKDLRVGIQLTKAALKTEGLSGLADGLAVLRGLLETFWEGLHPELDEDDDNDPTMRINAFADLCETAGVVAWVKQAPIVDVRGLGRFSLRDYALASGELEPSPSDGDPPSTATIEAAFTAVDIEELQRVASAAEQARDHATAIEAAFTERAGPGYAPDLSALREPIERARRLLAERLERRGVGGDEAGDEAADGGDGESAASGGGPRLSGTINSREEVIRALDMICDYFRGAEPSSPIPILLERAKRLVTMSFVDIVRDIAPEAIDQVIALGGRSQEEQPEE